MAPVCLPLSATAFEATSTSHLPNTAASNLSAPADSAGRGLDLYVEFIAVLAAR